MSQLCFYIPPFSADYAGACSALFGTKGMVVVDDGSCCTKHYTTADEPRWFGNRQPVFCSELRELDAVLGDDEKIVRKIKGTLKHIKTPEFIALIGSPVPAVIGTDLQGLAFEVEEETGIPSFGVPTTGLGYYNRGIAMAMEAVIKKFAHEPKNKQKRSVNILGYTPLDFYINENYDDLKNWISDAGWEINVCLMMDTDTEQISRLAEAEMNLVVSSSGLAAAGYLKHRWNMPYVTGLPVCGDGKYLSDLMDGKEDMFVPESGRILIIGDQILANSCRRYLMEKHGAGSDVGTFFGLEKEIASGFDIDIKSEDMLMQIFNSGRYDAVICDPIFENVPHPENLRFYHMPHIVVSSYLYWDSYLRFFSSDMENILKASCNDRNLRFAFGNDNDTTAV